MNTIKVMPLSDQYIARPLWSVIIPTHNSMKYLKETIESVLIQDRGSEQMEIWVVDDCSTENPQNMVEKLGKGRIQFYRQKQNVGQLDNFSTCLNLSKGKIIHLLHGDDFINPGFYESLEESIVSDDSIGAAFTGHNVVDEYSMIIKSSEIINSEPGVIDDFLSIIASKQIIQTPAIVVKREVYEKLGAFNKDLTWVEDWEMWVRIACNYNFYYNPRNLASYRVHTNSNTADSMRTGRFVTDAIKGINMFSGYLHLPKKEKKAIVNSAKQHYFNFAINQSIFRKSWPILIRCFLLIYNYSLFIQFIKYSMMLLMVYIKSIANSKD